MEEIWKDIKNYEGIYQVSNTGKVKRLACITTMRNQVTSWEQKLPEYIFSPCLDSKGYPQVLLTMGSEKRVARVHRLVAEAFLEEPSAQLKKECENASVKYVLINHKDGNPENNHINNLEWCSPRYNCDYCVKIGTHNPVKGEENYNAVLTEEDVLKIYQLACSRVLSQEKIGEMFGVKQITVSNIRTGRSWAWLTGQKPTPRTRKKVGGASLSEQKLTRNSLINHTFFSTIICNRRMCATIAST